MARGVELTRMVEQQVPTAQYGDAFRIRIVVSRASDIPEEIFLFKADLLDPHSGLSVPHFETVCSPEDLVTYPVGEPNLQQQPSFFRLSVIDVLTPSRRHADFLWSSVRTAVCNLITALNLKETLLVQDTAVCGELTDESISDSESDSA